jgi:hypothetical protein
MIAIGIDPGVNTGFAIWSTDRFKLTRCESMSIILAMEEVKLHAESARELGHELIVIVEDARKRKGKFTIADENAEKYGGGVREGVGSVKRDSKIWEEFLEHHRIPYELRMPRGTKLPDDQFKRLTGWVQRTNKHGRDAAMIVFQLNYPQLRMKLETYKQSREPKHESSLPAGARLRTGRRA